MVYPKTEIKETHITGQLAKILKSEWVGLVLKSNMINNILQ